MDNADLAGLLSPRALKNSWYSRHAQRLLQERAIAGKLDPADRATLLRPERDDATGVGSLRRFWTWAVTGPRDDQGILSGLDNPWEHHRAWAVTFALEEGRVSGVVASKLAELAKSDPSPVVRLALASGLQRLAVAERGPIAEALMAHEEDAADAQLPLMIWYGIEPLVSSDRDRAISLVAKAKIPLVRQYITRRLASLAK